jgi:hypothetical protein
MCCTAGIGPQSASAPELRLLRQAHGPERPVPSRPVVNCPFAKGLGQNGLGHRRAGHNLRDQPVGHRAKPQRPDHEDCRTCGDQHRQHDKNHLQDRHRFHLLRGHLGTAGRDGP